MADYIEFELNGRMLRLNREDSNDLQIWCDKWTRGMLKNPHWRAVAINKMKRQYLLCSIGRKKYTHHRVVYYAHNPDWDIHDSCPNNHIDHIDGDRTNNHISNLRVVTQAENNQNLAPARGYYFNKSLKKWQSQISINNIQTYLGVFKTEQEAKQAYLKAKKEHHPFARQS